MLPHHAPLAGKPHNNPRRTSAKKSVSLRHPPRPQRNSDSSADSSDRFAVLAAPKRPDENSPSTFDPADKHSSEESSNAEGWFEKSNNAIAGHEATFEDDPPFFLRNSSSEDQASGQSPAQQQTSPQGLTGSENLRVALLQLGTDGSSTDDFRGVIDDLTVENKKLRKRLKRYERYHDSHLKDERLFEVRVHGLPPDKKRELEETLRKFATGLDTPALASKSNAYSGIRAIMPVMKSMSSSNSAPNTDSAYASMSASGNGSSSSSTKNRKRSNVHHQNIHSYLHHIPEGLLPQTNPEALTERARKKLVVRRLEQLFAGKGAAPSGHQQAEQQQVVSQSAARADQVEQEAQGNFNKEGVREASIMRHDEQDDGGGDQDAPATTVASQAPPTQAKRGLEQRPTRPLDLDPYRAQVPAENMRYIRHLGFTLPDPRGRSPQDDEGWVYLNLLIGMAQLHTINVTSDFVRAAVGEMSNKLEVSEDGRKIRWKGGRSLTRTSSNGDTPSYSHTDEDSSRSPRKRVKLGGALDMRASGRTPGARSQQMEAKRFAYTPIFVHRSSADEQSSSTADDGDSSSAFPRPVGGDSSGMTSSGMHTGSSRPKQKHEDGPIVFYNNARFCTDLSGDTRSLLSPGAPIYKASEVTPIGAPSTITLRGRAGEKRGPLSFLADAGGTAASTEGSEAASADDLEFPTSSPASQTSPPAKPVDFEVTGIGGVYPADNFAIAVRGEQPIKADLASKSVRQGRRSGKALPARFTALLANTTCQEGMSNSAHFTTEHRHLPPSALPPALTHILSGSDSISDNGSNVEASLSAGPDSAGSPRLAAPQLMDMHRSGYDSDEEMDDYDDESESDGSLDLLALARQVDPEAVRMREREYDANMAERLAEGIPAGSSAATAGGGSEFASPATTFGKVQYVRAMQEARAGRRVAQQQVMSGPTRATDLQDTSSGGEGEAAAASDTGS